MKRIERSKEKKARKNSHILKSDSTAVNTGEFTPFPKLLHVSLLFEGIFISNRPLSIMLGRIPMVGRPKHVQGLHRIMSRDLLKKRACSCFEMDDRNGKNVIKGQ